MQQAGQRRSRSSYRILFPSTLLIVFTLCLQGLWQPCPAESSSAGCKVILQAESFPVTEDPSSVPGWTSWSQRDETRPKFFTSELQNLGEPGCLGISGASNNSAHGCWRKVVSGIKPGSFYRFEAWYQALSVPYPRQQVLSRLDWLDAEGKRVHQPEYVPEAQGSGGWEKNEGLFKAPEGAASVCIELYLSYCPQGTVWWDKISLAEVPDPGKRMVRVATVNFKPDRKYDSPEKSVASYLPLVEEAGQKGCDIVCLGEGINLAGVRNAGYPDVAEPIPGPTTKKLGELARKYKMYVVAALGERQGHAVYNAAVLIDREGRLAGKYRKVYLPREEVEAGCTPGNSYPVFDTDFGRIGMMICWDLQYIDPARALAVQGAEIIFCPIWGGNAILAKARAIENQTYLVTSSYSKLDPPTAIYGHWGDIIVQAKEKPQLIIADIDLNERFPHDWLGNMRDRFHRERRADIKVTELER